VDLFVDLWACAYMIVINKTDLMNDEVRASVAAEVLSEARDAVHIVHTAHGAVDIQVLLGIKAGAEDDLDSRPSHHDTEDDHDHDDFESFDVGIAATNDPEALCARIRACATEHNILRIKGFAEVEGKDMRLLVQGVGPRIQHYYDRDWQPGEARFGRLVVIGESGLDQAAIRAALSAEA
jgi:cobalamin biosynthesis protein CobW